MRLSRIAVLTVLESSLHISLAVMRAFPTMSSKSASLAALSFLSPSALLSSLAPFKFKASSTSSSSSSSNAPHRSTMLQQAIASKSTGKVKRKPRNVLWLPTSHDDHINHNDALLDCFLSNCSDSSEYFSRKYPTSKTKYRAVLPNYTDMKVSERKALGEKINFYAKTVSKQGTDEESSGGGGGIADTQIIDITDITACEEIEPANSEDNSRNESVQVPPPTQEEENALTVLLEECRGALFIPGSLVQVRTPGRPVIFVCILGPIMRDVAVSMSVKYTVNSGIISLDSGGTMADRDVGVEDGVLVEDGVAFHASSVCMSEIGFQDAPVGAMTERSRDSAVSVLFDDSVWLDMDLGLGLQSSDDSNMMTSMMSNMMTHDECDEAMKLVDALTPDFFEEKDLTAGYQRECSVYADVTDIDIQRRSDDLVARSLHHAHVTGKENEELESEEKGSEEKGSEGEQGREKEREDRGERQDDDNEREHMKGSPSLTVGTEYVYVSTDITIENTIKLPGYYTAENVVIRNIPHESPLKSNQLPHTIQTVDPEQIPQIPTATETIPGLLCAFDGISDVEVSVLDCSSIIGIDQIQDLLREKSIRNFEEAKPFIHKMARNALAKQWNVQDVMEYLHLFQKYQGDLLKVYRNSGLRNSHTMNDVLFFHEYFLALNVRNGTSPGLTVKIQELFQKACDLRGNILQERPEEHSEEQLAEYARASFLETRRKKTALYRERRKYLKKMSLGNILIRDAIYALVVDCNDMQNTAHLENRLMPLLFSVGWRTVTDANMSSEVAVMLSPWLAVPISDGGVLIDDSTCDITLSYRYGTPLRNADYFVEMSRMVSYLKRTHAPPLPEQPPPLPTLECPAMTTENDSLALSSNLNNLNNTSQSEDRIAQQSALSDIVPLEESGIMIDSIPGCGDGAISSKSVGDSSSELNLNNSNYHIDDNINGNNDGRNDDSNDNSNDIIDINNNNDNNEIRGNHENKEVISVDNKDIYNSNIAGGENIISYDMSRYYTDDKISQSDCGSSSSRNNEISINYSTENTRMTNSRDSEDDLMRIVSDTARYDENPYSAFRRGFESSNCPIIQLGSFDEDSLLDIDAFTVEVEMVGREGEIESDGERTGQRMEKLEEEKEEGGEGVNSEEAGMKEQDDLTGVIESEPEKGKLSISTLTDTMSIEDFTVSYFTTSSDHNMTNIVPQLTNNTGNPSADGKHITCSLIISFDFLWLCAVTQIS